MPDVLKRGIILNDDSHENHKGRGIKTVTFAGPVKINGIRGNMPVKINGIRGNMAVVVKATGKNRYKTHRILMPDCSEFILDKEKNRAYRLWRELK